MAAAKKNTGSGRKSSSTTHKKTSSGKKPSSSSARSTARTTTRSRKQDDVVEVGFGDYWHYFTKTKVFIPIMTIIVSAVIVGLDLLIAWNSYQRFFLFLGIEVIIAAVIWLIIMIYSLGSEKRSGNPDSEV